MIHLIEGLETKLEKLEKHHKDRLLRFANLCRSNHVDTRCIVWTLRNLSRFFLNLHVGSHVRISIAVDFT